MGVHSNQHHDLLSDRPVKVALRHLNQIGQSLDTVLKAIFHGLELTFVDYLLEGVLYFVAPGHDVDQEADLRGVFRDPVLSVFTLEVAGGLVNDTSKGVPHAVNYGLQIDLDLAS